MSSKRHHIPQPSGRKGVLRRVSASAVACVALASWLLGGLLLPLLHQLNHDHAHSHGTSRRLIHTPHRGTFLVAVAPHQHKHHKHRKHQHHKHSHDHHASGGHHHDGLIHRAWRWLSHVWSHHTHHHHDTDEAQPEASPFDASHGEGSLAHFDLLDKTSVTLACGAPHVPDMRPLLSPKTSQRPAAPLVRLHHARAPPV